MMKKQRLLSILCLISALAILGCVAKESSVPQSTSASAPNPSSTMAPTETAGETPQIIQKAAVISEFGNLREDKSLKARILKIMPQDTWVEVIQAEKQWLYVKTTKGELGWLNRDSTRMLEPYVEGGRNSSQTVYPTPPSEDIPNGRELYDEVQRLKSRDGLTDREAVRKILREMGEIQ